MLLQPPAIMFQQMIAYTKTVEIKISCVRKAGNISARFEKTDSIIILDATTKLPNSSRYITDNDAATKIGTKRRAVKTPARAQFTIRILFFQNNNYLFSKQESKMQIGITYTYI